MLRRAVSWKPAGAVGLIVAFTGAHHNECSREGGKVRNDEVGGWCVTSTTGGAN